MTQNNGWSYGGNDGVTDATRPLQNVNGQASYQPANQQQGQNAYPQRICFSRLHLPPGSRCSGRFGAVCTPEHR